jgi:MFS family permease
MDVDDRTRALATASAALFLAGLVWYNYSALLPMVVEDWSLSGTAAGAVFAAFQLGYVLAVLPAGSLADSVSARRVVAGGCLLAGAASLAFAFLARGPVVGAALRVVAGVGMAGVYVPGMRFVSGWYPADDGRGRAVGLYVGAFSLSSGLSFVLASTVAAATDWRTAIAVTSVGALAAAPLVLVATRDRPGSAESSGARFDRSLLRDRDLGLAVTAYSGHNWELFAARNWLPAFLLAAPAVAALPNASTVAGVVVGVAAAAGAVANPLSGWLSDRLGRHRTLAGVFVASAALSLGMGLLQSLSLPLLLAAVLVYGLVLTGDSAPTSTLVTEVAPDDQTGAALGLQSVVGFGVSVVSPVVFGAAYGYGGFALAFPTAALGPLVGLAALGWLARHRRGHT